MLHACVQSNGLLVLPSFLLRLDVLIAHGAAGDYTEHLVLEGLMSDDSRVLVHLATMPLTRSVEGQDRPVLSWVPRCHVYAQG